MHKYILLATFFFMIFSCKTGQSIKPVGPLPSTKQLAWHEMEYYAFVHFNMNTFTNMEWGLGGESPEQFNPSELDTRQWARVVKEAGMKGIIITAKHHDGFCLWPTSTTEHSVKNSPWKNGKGDVLKDLSKACKEYGLKFGVYLSPWDRDHKDYGKPEYITDFHKQLKELLTYYGDIFEVWFDGANGGSGYYGGANETRKIDSNTYYEWEKVTKIVRKLQPNAVIFGDGGPDVRWVGNEEGWANETNWSIMRRDEIYPGWPRYIELRSGHEDGTHWLPAEADVSIRPGWYYHSSEDHQVKSVPQLLDIYYNSVGRNASLLLNLPVDNRGLVHETDVQQLIALRKQLDMDFSHNLAKDVKVSATDVRGKSYEYSAGLINDEKKETYWATNDGVTKASITIEFDIPTEINRILLQEYIPLGQRVQNFIVEVQVDGHWEEIDRQTTIGYKRILRFNTVKASKVKIHVLNAKGAIALSNMEIYRAPNLLIEPQIIRNKNGMVSLLVPDKNVEVYYTLDGISPSISSIKYEKPFLVDQSVMVNGMAYDPEKKQQTGTVSTYFDVSKKEWKVIGATSGNIQDGDKMIDDNPKTFWATDKGVKKPQEVVIDLGKEHQLTGFTYWPIQERWSFGIITHYEFLVSADNRSWETVAQGEFGNVLNNPIEQKVKFNAIKGRYIKLKGIEVMGDDFRTSFGEVGIITSN